MADGQHTPTQGMSGTQDFGTVWIKDQNGVSQMVRVVQATPKKSPAAGPPAAPVVRAIVRRASPLSGGAASPAAAAVVGASRPTRPPLHTVRVVQPVRPAPAAAGVPAGIRLVQVKVGDQVVVRGPPAPARIATTPGRGPPAVPLPRASVSGVGAVTPTGRRPVSSRLVLTSPVTPGLVRRPGDRPLEARTAHPGFGSPSTPGPARTTKRPGDLSCSSESKRHRYDKTRSSKGLRLFSFRVCQKVREKGVTTYNEVADELVTELCSRDRVEENLGLSSPEEQHYEQKNIRRRVYDALNVLIAMEIIRKEGKQMRWRGLPGLPAEATAHRHSAQPAEAPAVVAEREQRVREKTQQLNELLLRQIAFRNLVDRNRVMEEQQGPPEPGSSVQLPFIVVNTNKKTVIDCSISQDKTEYLFNFDDAFEIHDDIEVLKRMGMTLGLESGTCGEGDLEKVKAMFSEELRPYIDGLARADSAAGGEPAEADVKPLPLPLEPALDVKSEPEPADPLLSQRCEPSGALDWLDDML